MHIGSLGSMSRSLLLNIVSAQLLESGMTYGNETWYVGNFHGDILGLHMGSRSRLLLLYMEKIRLNNLS